MELRLLQGTSVVIYTYVDIIGRTIILAKYMLYTTVWANKFFAAIRQHPHSCSQNVCINFFSRSIYTLKDSVLSIFYFKNGFPDLKNTLVPIFMHSAQLP